MSYFGGNKAPYLLWSHLDGATKYLTKCQPGSVFGSCIVYLRRWGVICGDRSGRNDIKVRATIRHMPILGKKSPYTLSRNAKYIAIEGCDLLDLKKNTI